MTWLTLAFGCLMVAFGVVAILHRRRIAEVNSDAQRQFFGAAGEYVASKSTPVWPLITGVVTILIGVSAILSAFVRLN